MSSDSSSMLSVSSENQTESLFNRLFQINGPSHTDEVSVQGIFLRYSVTVK